MFCLAFPCDLEADVSNGILLKILGVIKSTPRSVRGHLEVIHFVTLEGNGVSVTSTRCLGVLWGKNCLECPSGTRCLTVVPSNMTLFVAASMQNFCHVTPFPVSFCAWALVWSELWVLLYEVKCSVWGTWLQESLGHSWNVCLLWGWELGEGRGQVLCLGHVPVTSLAEVSLLQNETGLDLWGLFWGCGRGLAA